MGSKRPVVGGGQRSCLNNSLASEVESWPQYQLIVYENEKREKILEF